MTPFSPYQVGCAGWSIPSNHAAAFPAAGSHLERYAQRFSAVEINSSFYRPHRPQTYARWAASTPTGFRFAVKVPKEITHTRRLREGDAPLEEFLAQVGALGEKLGPLLVQLPPSLPFEAAAAGAFFRGLRRRFDGYIVCEPRHASWFTPEVDQALTDFEISRVAADPSPIPGAAELGGWPGLCYLRLHGSPRIYYSSYSEEYLDALSTALASSGGWCIFDNTAGGEATTNALGLLERLSGEATRRHG